MPRTKDLGCWYWHGLRYPVSGAPLYERASTVEIEWPFRQGAGWAFRLTPRRALVVGKWRSMERTEGQALAMALNASLLEVGVDEIRDWPGGTCGLEE